MQTTLSIAAGFVVLWTAIGLAVLLMQGRAVLTLGASANYHIRRYGRLPSVSTDVGRLATMIVLWPRWYWRLAK